MTPEPAPLLCPHCQAKGCQYIYCVSAIQELIERVACLIAEREELLRKLQETSRS
jgi:hypothetical protein